MATIAVTAVLQRCETILQDSTNTRWTQEELLSWFNDAQLAVASRRPDSWVTNETFSCAQGTKQSIPADGLRLVRVVRNSDGTAIRRIEGNILDDQIPDWHVNADELRVDHYVYEPSDPKTFYLYPAPAANVEIDIVYSVAPSPIVITDFETDTQTISLDDNYINALVDFVLFRCYQKDAQYASNLQRAQMHLQAFGMAIGDKTEADVALSQTHQAMTDTQQQ